MFKKLDKKKQIEKFPYIWALIFCNRWCGYVVVWLSMKIAELVSHLHICMFGIYIHTYVYINRGIYLEICSGKLAGNAVNKWKLPRELAHVCCCCYRWMLLLPRCPALFSRGLAREPLPTPLRNTWQWVFCVLCFFRAPLAGHIGATEMAAKRASQSSLFYTLGKFSCPSMRISLSVSHSLSLSLYRPVCVCVCVWVSLCVRQLSLGASDPPSAGHPQNHPLTPTSPPPPPPPHAHVCIGFIVNFICYHCCCCRCCFCFCSAVIYTDTIWNCIKN